MRFLQGGTEDTTTTVGVGSEFQLERCSVGCALKIESRVQLALLQPIKLAS